MHLPYTNVEALIPQRDPFICIGALNAFEAEVTESSFTIPADHLLIEEGHFAAEGLIENIAQTAAAGMGFASVDSGTPPAIGFIAAISNVNIHKLPPVNAGIRTIVKTERQVLNVTIIKGSSYMGDQLLAECQMKIFVHDE